MVQGDLSYFVLHSAQQTTTATSQSAVPTYSVPPPSLSVLTPTPPHTPLPKVRAHTHMLTPTYGSLVNNSDKTTDKNQAQMLSVCCYRYYIITLIFSHLSQKIIQDFDSRRRLLSGCSVDSIKHFFTHSMYTVVDLDSLSYYSIHTAVILDGLSYSICAEPRPQFLPFHIRIFSDIKIIYRD